jgi:hypothetical protein
VLEFFKSILLGNLHDMIILSSNFFDIKGLPFALDILFAPLRILIYQSGLIVCEFKILVHFIDKKSIFFFTP